MKRIFISIALIGLSLTAWASPILNVFTWANYIPQKVIAQFEKQTGIIVHLSYFASNAILYAKLKADPHIGYDVIVPSSYTVDRLRRQHMLHPLNKKYLSNLRYLNPIFLNQAFDPGNRYSVPYMVGTTALVVNKKYWDPRTVTDFRDLFNHKFHNQLLLINDMRAAFSMALIDLGYSINTRRPKQIQKAYHLLLKLIPNIKLFVGDPMTDVYSDGDATVGMGWSGDIYRATLANPNLAYIYPKKGFSIWIDCLAIPKYAPHLKNALKFINFLMRPKIAEECMQSNGDATPNLAGMKLAPKSISGSHIINPSAKTLKRGQYQLYLGPARTLYERDWELLKLHTGGSGW